MNINLATKHHVFVANLYSDAVSAPKNAILIAELHAVPPAPTIKPVYGL